MSGGERARLWSLLTVALLVAPDDALVLRSSDDALHVVDTTSAVAHSGLLRNLVSDVGDGNPVPVPQTAGSDLEPIVDFINTVAVDEVGIQR